VLLSSHILAEAEALCDTVSIIRAGRIVESGSLATLRHLTRTTLHVTTREPLDGLDTTPGIHDVVVTDAGHTASFEVEADRLGAVIEHIGQHGVVALTSAPPTLEELFLRHYGDELAALNRNGAGTDVAGRRSRHARGEAGR